MARIWDRWDSLRLPTAHLLHIGKTGGTAVKEALRGSRARNYYVKRHSHGVRMMDIPDDEFIIFFVRDPISRYISGFHSRQRQGRPRYNIPWSDGERSAFEHFSTPNSLAEALSDPDEQRRAAARAAMASITHVKDHFSNWLGSSDYLTSRGDKILFIGFQEQLGSDWDVLREMLGIDRRATLPDDDVRAHRNPKDLPRWLSATAQHNLREWYSSDLAIFETCRELRNRTERTATPPS